MRRYVTEKGKEVNIFQIYCSDPNCRKPITGERIAYDREERRFYHPGTCELRAVARVSSNLLKVVKFSVLTPKQALGLVRHGRVDESSLTKKLE